MLTLSAKVQANHLRPQDSLKREKDVRVVAALPAPKERVAGVNQKETLTLLCQVLALELLFFASIAKRPACT